ncbi:MAG: primosomal protein N' [Anaerolineales bacterium]
MPRYFQVALNLPQISEVFDYHLPESLENSRLDVGALVLVPFASQRVQGVIWKEVETPSIPSTRPIDQILDAQSVLPRLLLRLAQRLAEETLTPLGMWIGFLLPEGYKQRSDWIYRWRGENIVTNWTPLQKQIIAQLQSHGALRRSQLDHRFARRDWRKALQPLIRKGWIEVEPWLVSPKVGIKYSKMVSLLLDPSRFASFLDRYGQRWGRARERRKKVLEFLAEEGKAVEATWVYAACGANLADLKKLAELGAIRLEENIQWRDPLASKALISYPRFELTSEQAAAWEIISASLHQAWQGKVQKPILLHGVTGSGKTELYLRAVEETLEAGRQAIVLVPEISLTPQTIERFSARFLGKVGIYHSRLSLGERFDMWQRCRSGQLEVIVGARSALFVPFAQPGLVVIDECHDPSYYQDAQPNYHAVQAAIAYMQIAGGVCLLGSATPTIEQSFWARQGIWQGITLTKRILSPLRNPAQSWLANGEKPPFSEETEFDRDARQLSSVKIVDMRAELKQGNRSIFSRTLTEALRQVLTSGQQAILFLNRRGLATYVFCRDCGYVVKCPHCHIPLTVHGNEQSAKPQGMLCHRCGYRRQSPQRCPQCSSTHIRQMGIGTQRVEEEIGRLFPGARLLRWDADTTRQKGAHKRILDQFTQHQADILIGTQMLAKGLDIPLVTLVGVILAEVGLNLPDFRAAERTFQLLTQVAGRAGRSVLGGKVIVQTYNPDHYAIEAAALQDYELFYQCEIQLRKEIQYPPFAEIVRLEFRHLDAAEAQREAERQYHELENRLAQERISTLRLSGPLPCYYSKVGGWYRWQILIIGDQPQKFLSHQTLRKGWRIEINPINLL